jgi:hypothetical protein
MNPPPRKINLELISLGGTILKEITLEEKGTNTIVGGNFLTPGNYLAKIHRIKRMVELKAKKDYGKTITIEYS